MNRLTVRYSGIHVGYKNKYNNSVLCSEMTVPQIRECMEKLAAYEDTGLEPEEVKQLNASDASKEESSIKYYNEMRKYRDELKYYKDLEKQGLLIKLPCKVGDTVYKLEDYGEWQDVPHALIPIMCQVELIFIGDDNKVYCDLMSIDLLQDGAMFDEIPINEIYLSEEEAEKALKEMEGKQ